MFDAGRIRIRGQLALRLLLIGVGGFAVALGTILLARQGLGIAPVWPLNGLLVVIAVASRPGWRAPQVLAGLAGAAGANAWVGDPPMVIAGFAAANALLIGLAATALSRLRGGGIGRLRLRRVAMRFAVALIVAPAAAALLTAAMLAAVRGAPVLAVAELSFEANVLGLGMFTPFLLAGRRMAAGTPRRRLMLPGALVVVTGVSVAVFTQSALPFGFLLLPVQALAALAGGLVGALASQAIVAAAGFALTSLGHGYVAGLSEDLVTRAQFLQLLLGCNGIAVLLLGLLVDRQAAVTARLHGAQRRAVAAAAGDRAFHRAVGHWLQGPLPAPLRADAEGLVAALAGGLETAAQMRALTGPREGAAAPTVGPVPLPPVLREVCADLAPLAADRRVSVRLRGEVRGEAGATPVANPPALRAILLALGRNGISYRRHDGGELAFVVQAEGAMVRIAVEDDGVGIAASAAHRLFQSFDRLGLEQYPVAGLGLGLSQGRRLAEAMGGTLDHESDASRTRFVLRLPAAA